MAEYLFIRLSESGEECESVALDAEGRVILRPRRQSLTEAARDAVNRKVIVLVPGTEVVTTQAELPKVAQSRLRQLLPFSLEETLADDIDRLHFAAGKRIDDKLVSAAVVDRELLDGWIDRIESAGIRAAAVYAETEGVADTPSTLNLIVDEGVDDDLDGRRVYGRRPGKPAFVLEGFELPDVYRLLHDGSGSGDEDADLRHVMVYSGGRIAAGLAAEIAELKTLASSVDVKELGDGALPRFAANLVIDGGTNLLQGDYAPKSNWAGLARPWYAAASLLLAVVGAAIAVQAAEYFSLRNQDRELTDLLTASCSSAFAATGLSSCAAEVRRRLSDAGASTSGAGTGFLTTLAAVAEHGTDNLLQALSYRDAVMDLRVTVPSVTDLDSLRQQIVGTKRFDVRVESTTPGDKGVEGRLKIVEAGP
jgi:general secretion pathway protein L